MIRLSTLAALLTAAATVFPLSPVAVSAATTAVARTTSTPSSASATNLTEAVRETIRERAPVDTASATVPARAPTTMPTTAPSHSAVASADGGDGKNQSSQTPDPAATEAGQATSDGTTGPDSTGSPRAGSTSCLATSSGTELPSDVLDLKNWYLTLPTGTKDDPATVLQPDLQTYTSPHFQLDVAKDGVVFTAPVGGVTTKNSEYPRSELREMNGQEKAAWSNRSGVHTLKVTEAVTELPKAKPETVTAQIHDGNDDVMQIRLEGSRLVVQYGDGAKEVTLDSKYKLGTVYEVAIEAADGRVQVYYNGVNKADLPLTGSNWYFKAGAYVQSNTSKGDMSTAIGQVVVYSLDVTHSQ